MPACVLACCVRVLRIAKHSGTRTARPIAFLSPFRDVQRVIFLKEISRVELFRRWLSVLDIFSLFCCVAGTGGGNGRRLLKHAGAWKIGKAY